MNSLLFDSITFTQVFCQGCPLLTLYALLLYQVLAIFIDNETRIKSIQIADHEIKIVNFADDTIIFLRNVGCLTKKGFILQLCEKASSSKTTFQKARPYDLQQKNRIDKPRQMGWSQLSIKTVEVHFGNSVHDNTNWDKICNNSTKKIHI